MAKEPKTWRLTIVVEDPDLKRRYKTVAAYKDVSFQDFGLEAMKEAVEAVELEMREAITGVAA